MILRYYFLRPAALPMGGKKPFTLADEEAWIRARVAEKPDLTGRELLAELNQRGIEVSYYGVWHFLDHGKHPAGTALSARARCPTLRAFLRAPLRVEHTADGNHYRS